MDKSHVTLEQKVCIVCGTAYDSGALLLDTRLRARFDMHTVTGWGMCPNDAAKKAEGYVALVEVSNGRDGMKPDEWNRTGRIAHVREAAFTRIFDVPAPTGKVAIMEPGVIEKLQAMTGNNHVEQRT